VLLPRAFARTHPVHRAPHVAIAAQTCFAFVVALLASWICDPFPAFTIMATTLTILIIVVFMMVCVVSSAFYLRRRRGELNVVLHGVLPLLSAAALVGPLYYEFAPLPPYAQRYANWIALGWIALGAAVPAWMARHRRPALEAAARIFVKDDTADRPAAVAGRGRGAA
jgi:amino acid transporter